MKWGNGLEFLKSYQMMAEQANQEDVVAQRCVIQKTEDDVGGEDRKRRDDSIFKENKLKCFSKRCSGCIRPSCRRCDACKTGSVCSQKICKDEAELLIKYLSDGFEPSGKCNRWCGDCMQQPVCNSCLVCLDKKYFNNFNFPNAACIEIKCITTRGTGLEQILRSVQMNQNHAAHTKPTSVSEKFRTNQCPLSAVKRAEKKNPYLVEKVFSFTDISRPDLINALGALNDCAAYWKDSAEMKLRCDSKIKKVRNELERRDVEDEMKMAELAQQLEENQNNENIEAGTAAPTAQEVQQQFNQLSKTLIEADQPPRIVPPPPGFLSASNVSPMVQDTPSVPLTQAVLADIVSQNGGSFCEPIGRERGSTKLNFAKVKPFNVHELTPPTYEQQEPCDYNNYYGSSNYNSEYQKTSNYDTQLQKTPNYGIQLQKTSNYDTQYQKTLKYVDYNEYMSESNTSAQIEQRPNYTRRFMAPINKDQYTNTRMTKVEQELLAEKIRRVEEFGTVADEPKKIYCIQQQEDGKSGKSKKSKEEHTFVSWTPWNEEYPLLKIWDDYAKDLKAYIPAELPLVQAKTETKELVESCPITPYNNFLRKMLTQLLDRCV